MCHVRKYFVLTGACFLLLLLRFYPTHQFLGGKKQVGNITKLISTTLSNSKWRTHKYHHYHHTNNWHEANRNIQPSGRAHCVLADEPAPAFVPGVHMGTPAVSHETA